MTWTQLAALLAAWVATLAVVSSLLNKRIDDLRGEMLREFSYVRGDLKELRTDLKELRTFLGQGTLTPAPRPGNY